MFSNKLWQWTSRLALVFTLLVGTFPVQAGWLPLNEPSVTAVSNACSTASGTTITFTAQGVGGANPNRITVVSINWDDSTNAGTAALNAVTVGGISMLRAASASIGVQNSNSEIWYVANPSGITANIVATFASSVNGITIEVYSLIGYIITPITSTTGTTSVSQTYNNKQLALAAGSRTINVSTSLSNLTNDFSSACGANLWGVHASQVLRGTNQTLTSTISPTSNTPKIALAIWSTQPPACVAAFSIGNSTNTTSWNGSTSNNVTISLSTGSVVIVTVRLAHTTTNLTVSSVASSHLTFAQVPGAQFFRTDTSVDSAHTDSEMWWAYSSGPLTNEVITVTASSTVTDASIGAFEAKGVVNPQNPWDQNVSLAAKNGGTGTNATISGVSTNNSTPVVILSNMASAAQSNFSVPGAVPVFNQIQAFGGGGVSISVQQHNYYLGFATAQSAATYTAFASSQDWVVLVHAVMGCTP